jgi:hypothetical protein
MLVHVRAAASQQPIPDDVSAACARLARYYSDYVPENDWAAVIDSALVAAGFDRDDRAYLVETFDEHESDVLDG